MIINNPKCVCIQYQSIKIHKVQTDKTEKGNSISIIIVGDFNILASEMYRIRIQKISRNINYRPEQHNNQLYLIDIYGTLHSTTIENTEWYTELFSSACQISPRQVTGP